MLEFNQEWADLKNPGYLLAMGIRGKTVAEQALAASDERVARKAVWLNS